MPASTLAPSRWRSRTRLPSMPRRPRCAARRRPRRSSPPGETGCSPTRRAPAGGAPSGPRGRRRARTGRRTTPPSAFGPDRRRRRPSRCAAPTHAAVSALQELHGSGPARRHQPLRPVRPRRSPRRPGRRPSRSRRSPARRPAGPARARASRGCARPEAPIGWPSATAPPLTLTLSSSMPSIRIEFSATEAKASLISQRSMSSADRPTFASAASAALAGVRAR